MPEIFYTVIFYLLKFGPILIFLALLFGIVGLPIPDEMILMGAGYLVAHQKMNFPLTVIASLLGAICGITTSYLLGRLVGKWFLKKFAKKLNITEEKIKLVKTWFSKIGVWLLVVCFYIPFFRHLIGFVAGGTKLDYKKFALFAYTGAIIWASTFLTIGYFLEGVQYKFK